MTRATAAAAPEHLRSLAARLRERAEAVRRQQPDGWHDLRVACRRLEVELRLWCRRRVAADAQRGAGDLRRAAGPVREQEVLAVLLRTRRSGARVVPADLRQRWLAELAVQAEASSARVAGPRTVSRLVSQVGRAASALAAEREREREERAMKRLGRWRAQARARLADGLASGEAEALHRARLAIKRWRYAEERLAGAGVRALRQELRRWQRWLGELNDRVLLIEHAARSGRSAQPLVQRLEALRRAAVRRLPVPRGALASVRRPRA